MSTGATLPQLLWRNAARWPTRPAWREKRLGVWQTASWSAFAARTGEIALGLAAQGFGAGARLAVLGDNRPDLYAALLAAQTLGGTGVPLDPDTEPALLAALLRTYAPAAVITETAEQAARLRPLAAPARVIPAERSRPHDDAADGPPDLAALAAAGRTLAENRPDPLGADLARGTPDDHALLLSAAPAGAGGEPRAVPFSHARLLAAATAIAAADPARPTDEAFCYLPIASCEDAVYSLALGLLCGFACNCPEAPDSVPRDLREIGPSILFVSPAACTALAQQVTARSAAASPLKRRSFGFFQALALRADALREQGRRIPPGTGFGCRIGELVAYGPVRDQLGLRRARWVHVGTPVPAEAARLLRALGVPLRPATPAATPEDVGLPQGEALHA